MATNNAPKHDFAPAWLKIPTNENTKPPSSKQGKRVPVGSNSKSRHHSVDDDYYAYNYGAYAYYNGYGYGEKLGSQPSLVRTPSQRDNKYQHPHARYGAGQNLGYPSYYDFLPSYEYYGNDPYYNNYPANRGSSRKSLGDTDGRSNSKESNDPDQTGEKEEDPDKPFTDDFPSLNGGLDKTTATTKGSKQMNGTSGVWDKPRKSGSGKGVNDGENDSSQTKVLRDANIYKNLVPTKSTIPRRPARMNGSTPKEQGPAWGLKPSIPTSSSSPPGVNKEMIGPASTAPIDILNTRFVTQPKTLSDKKSNFLKALRQEDEKLADKKYGSRSDGSLTNGIDSLNINDDGSHLSSSLEAEQRLLREMGWNEADDEVYEITEDDKKQFHNLAKNVTQQQRNGPRSIPKTWSPKHIPLYQPDVHELNETLSSSDSDSDDCEN